MKLSALVNALNTLSIKPVYYRSVPSGVKLPFVTWYQQGTDNMPADDSVWKQYGTIYVDLYTEDKNFVLEQEVESVLNRTNIVWDKTETKFSGEAALIISYSFTVPIEN